MKNKDLVMLNDPIKSVSINPYGLLLPELLFDRNIVRKAITKYRSMERAGADPPAHIVLSEIESFFYSIEAAYRNEYPDKIKKIELACLSDSVQDAIIAFRIIDAWLYKKGVTKFDTRTKVNALDVEAENENEGL